MRRAMIAILWADSNVTINMAKGSVLASRVPVGLALGDSDTPQKHCAFRLNGGGQFQVPQCGGPL
jgi:hypothetical protein